MAKNKTNRMTVSLAGDDSQRVMNTWRRIALECGYPGRENQGGISQIFVAVGRLSEADLQLFIGFLKKLLTK